ncbi:serine/threonine-protein kinase Nek8-like [Halyomorpha halys]|uniref:serine/threonine-protein kinase Nek8-like n=1 Tax=Halyomorpha halys TaxID=286706 RepID=UPI0006D4FFEB
MWALGCILYELACREKTFQGSNLPALVNKIMKGVYEPLPSIYSSGLKLLVSDLLQKDPSLRPPASVVSRRVVRLYEKIAAKSKGNRVNYKAQKIRSVLFQLSGEGPSFQLSPVRLPPKTKILRVAVGAAHYIALTSDTLVYTWGEGKRGELGYQPTDWQEEPKLVEALLSKSVAAVSAGNGFSAFVTDSGLVLTCGNGSRGCLGHGDFEDHSCPKIIDKLLNMDVTDISCGDDHVACLTRDGKVYTWGVHPTGATLCSPELEEIPAEFTAVAVKCGPNVVGVLTSCGRLLVAGSNDSNRLGLDTWSLLGRRTTNNAVRLTLVRSLTKWKLKSVSFGRSHSAALTRDGRVLTMGSGTDCQLGHSCDRWPAPVEKMALRVITMVECGPTFTLVSCEENALYFWGTRFTQGKEMIGNSRISMSTLETQVVVEPQEVLALYCSEKQISEGLTVTVNSIYTQWHCIFLLVDTTAPYKKSEETTKEVPKEEEHGEDFDTLGPVPDWIKEELAKATHSWPGNDIRA